MDRIGKRERKQTGRVTFKKSVFIFTAILLVAGLLLAGVAAADGKGKCCDVDIKPGSYPNSINLKSRGTISVALISTDDCDAPVILTMLDRTTFAGAPALFQGLSPKDLNGDGRMDMVLHFQLSQTNLTPGDSYACVMVDDYTIGCDSVRVKDK